MNFVNYFLDHKELILSSLSYMFNTFVSVFVMVDPLAAIPIYLILTERFTTDGVRDIRRKGVIVATSILFMFALTGMGILNFFGISMAALQIAGGILLLMFSIEHMSGPEKINHEEEDEGLHRDEISVVPLAMPLLAGPGAISTIVVQSTRATNSLNLALLIITICIVMYVTYVILKFSRYLYKLLGKTGLNLIGRIMGILVAAIAIEFVITGLRDVFPNLWK
jgi:multiple antibiotic resistance protein